MGAVEEEPGLASSAGDAQVSARGRLIEEVLLRSVGSEGGNAGFGESQFPGSGVLGPESGLKIGKNRLTPAKSLGFQLLKPSPFDRAVLKYA